MPIDWKIGADVLRDHSATTIFRVKQLLFLDCLTEDEGTMILQNVSNNLPNNTT